MSNGAHHAPAAEPLTPEEEYANEKFLFKALRYTHLIIFIIQILVQVLKRKLWHDVAQALSALLLCCAMIPMLFNIWYSKTRLAEWENN